MKKYRLKKDLPTFKAGQECWLSPNGDLMTKTLWSDSPTNPSTVFEEDKTIYSKRELERFPNILKDWFEEIPEQPKTVWDLKEGDRYWYIRINNWVDVNNYEPVALDELLSSRKGTE